MKILKWINTFAYLAMVTINILANRIPLGGKTTGEISDAYPSLFTPTGMTFSIWGVIYALLGLFILYQWGILSSTDESNLIVNKLSWLFFISCMLNILWVVLWHNLAIGWSVVCIGTLLLSLMLMQNRLNTITVDKNWLHVVMAGFDIYYGWIIAATIANISVWLVKIDWDRLGLSEAFWTVVMLVIGAAAGVFLVMIDLNHLAGITIIWSYIGILIKHLSRTGYASAYPMIIVASILGIFAIAIALLSTLTFPSVHKEELL